MTELSQLPRNSFDVDDSLSAAARVPSRVQGGGTAGDDQMQAKVQMGICGVILVVALVVWAVMGFPQNYDGKTLHYT